MTELLEGTRLQDLIEAMIAPVREAGAAALAIRAEGLAVMEKGDRSPVTLADQKAEAILIAALEYAAPGLMIVAEERVEAEGLPDFDCDQPFVLIDPLDGTKEFIRGGDDFTVNVGFIKDRKPLAGLVYAPVTDTLYAGIVGEGAWLMRGSEGTRQALEVRALDSSPPTIVASKSHGNSATDDWLSHYPDCRRVSVGSSLKFCLVACADADIYPRLGPTMEWDTAAGDAVLRAAGGRVAGPEGCDFTYGKDAFRNTHFVAWGDPSLTPPTV